MCIYALPSDVVLVRFPLHLVQVACPQGQVVTQELHNGSRITVLVFFQVVEVGNCIIEGLLRDLASDFWAIQNFVVEDRIIESKAQSNWMRALQLLLCL